MASVIVIPIVESAVCSILSESTLLEFPKVTFKILPFLSRAKSQAVGAYQPNKILTSSSVVINFVADFKSDFVFDTIMSFVSPDVRELTEAAE